MRGQAGASGEEWPAYGRDPGGMRFSPLQQINRGNVGRLRRAWAYELPRGAGNGVLGFESTPVMVGDVLYFSTQAGVAIALDAETGKQLWLFDPYSGVAGERKAVVNRGVALWEGNASVSCSGQAGVDRRIFYIGPDARLFSVDAATGKPCRSFGAGGAIDLREGVAQKWPTLRYDVTSPPVIYRDSVITGSELQEYPSLGPSGAVRAFSVETGQMKWKFNTVPGPGETGHDTWEGDGWKDRSGTNAWGPISLDAASGMVFLPVGSPTYDFYGADRKGKNLFGNSLVALDAETGKLRWHYQVVHHDLWDYDLAAQPVLITVDRDGRKVPAVAEVTKTGYVFVFNRLTGQPLFPVEEKPVPASEIPGEASWPTQPIPVKPPSLVNHVVTRDDVTTVTLESRQYCLDHFGSILPSRLFDPWSTTLKLAMPGTLGGANWSGASFDPASGNLFVNVSELGTVGEMKRQPEGSPEAYEWGSPWGTYARFWDDHHFPCQQPPWGTLNAVNLNTGEIVWKATLGVVDALAAKGIPQTGIYNLGGSIATAGGLVFIGATSDHRLRAFDSGSGKELWVAQLESNGHATPLTYLGERNKRQYVVMAIGPGGNIEAGGSGPTALVAYALLPAGEKEAPTLTSGQASTRTIGSGPGSEPATLEPAPAAIAQPLPFSHREHVTAGMKCDDCHQTAGGGKDMGIPNVQECMKCHRTVRGDSAVIQKLAAMERSGQQIEWARVYQLPAFVFFSHEKHAKTGCEVCHGAVASRDALWQEKDESMTGCVNCHKLRQAPVSCGLCHTVGY